MPCLWKGTRFLQEAQCKVVQCTPYEMLVAETSQHFRQSAPYFEFRVEDGFKMTQSRSVLLGTLRHRPCKFSVAATW
jgi:hypothetical protein